MKSEIMMGETAVCETALMTRRRLIVGVVLAATLAITGSNPAPAQTFPSRPITIVVPFAAGGPIDTLVRVLAERMRAPLG
jgi:tripartite-type tricarboxylate transporter receptor subunit TctC